MWVYLLHVRGFRWSWVLGEIAAVVLSMQMTFNDGDAVLEARKPLMAARDKEVAMVE